MFNSYHAVSGQLWIIPMSPHIPSMFVFMHWPTRWHRLRIIYGFPHVWYLTQMRAQPSCRIRNTTLSWLGLNYDLASSSSIQRLLSLVSPMKSLSMLALTILTMRSFLLLTRSGYVYILG